MTTSPPLRSLFECHSFSSSCYNLTSPTSRSCFPLPVFQSRTPPFQPSSFLLSVASITLSAERPCIRSWYRFPPGLDSAAVDHVIEFRAVSGAGAVHLCRQSYRSLPAIFIGSFSSDGCFAPFTHRSRCCRRSRCLPSSSHRHAIESGISPTSRPHIYTASHLSSWYRPASATPSQHGCNSRSFVVTRLSRR